MADTRASSEAQASLSLTLRASSEHDAGPLKSPDPPPTAQSLVEKAETKDEPEREEYITGFKLHVVLFALALVGFIIMLDQTILATVRYFVCFNLQPVSADRQTQGYPAHHQCLRLSQRHWLVWICIHALTVSSFPRSILSSTNLCFQGLPATSLWKSISILQLQSTRPHFPTPTSTKPSIASLPRRSCLVRSRIFRLCHREILRHVHHRACPCWYRRSRTHSWTPHHHGSISTT